MVARREAYKAEWHAWWQQQQQQEGELDVILTVPNATPAVPHDGMKDAVSSCGYTFLFNLVRSFFSLIKNIVANSMAEKKKKEMLTY